MADDLANVEFFQFVRRLEREIWTHFVKEEERPKYMPRIRNIKFRARPGLAFPPGAVVSAERTSAKPPEWDVEVAFMGLTGAMGIMPPHYSVLLIDTSDLDRTGLRDFLDIFNHRIVELFHLARESTRPLFRFERAFQEHKHDSKDPLTNAIRSLVGLGIPSARKHLAISPRLPLYFSGAYLASERPACSLRLMLGETLDLPVEVDERVAEWLPIPERFQTRVGRCEDDLFEADDTFNAEVGKTACLGRNYWSNQDAFAVRIGPVSYEQFCRFVPIDTKVIELTEDQRRKIGDLYNPICDQIRLFSGLYQRISLEISLRPESVPDCQLGYPEEEKTAQQEQQPVDQKEQGLDREAQAAKQGEPIANHEEPSADQDEQAADNQEHHPATKKTVADEEEHRAFLGVNAWLTSSKCPSVDDAVFPVPHRFLGPSSSVDE